MADDKELNPPSFGNFSIHDTMEMTGSQELLNDLMGSETASSSPDDIQKIEKTEKKPTVTNTTTKKPIETTDIAPKEKSLAEQLLEEEGEEESSDVKIKTKTEEENEEDVPVSPFTTLTRDLFNLGVFSKEEGDEEPEITTGEAFLERFNQEKKKGAIEVVNQFIGQFGDDYQQAFEAIFVKGADPKEYFGTYNNIQNFAEMDLAQEANQIAIVRQMLTDQGLDPEDVTSEIEQIKSYGNLEEKSQKYHKVLVKKEAAKLAQIEQDSERKLQHQQAIKQQFVSNVNTVLQNKLKTKEFDGIPINPKLAGELQDFLITERYKTPSGETLTEFDRAILDLKRPENHEKKVKLGLLLKILEVDPTLSTIQNAGVSKKTDALFGEVIRQTSKTSVKSEKKEQPKSWF